MWFWTQKTSLKFYLLTGQEIECEILSVLSTKDVEKFHTKEEIEKYGFVVLSTRKKFN